MNNLYFDIAATTPLDNNVSKLMTEIQNTVFGNPSSIHQFGQKSRSLIETARRQMASSLNCKPNELIFTSGGSESNNLVLKGLLKAGDHLITSSYEHPAIIKVSQELEKYGVEVSYIKPNVDGIIDSNDIESAIKQNTKLISIMYVNNEIGSVNPIGNIVEVAKKNNIKVHTDAVQIIGKQPLDIKKIDVDFLSIAAHKYYGPKGIGALFVKSGNILDSVLQGGGQEKNLRPGTENISGIVGMGLATQIAIQNVAENSKKILDLENTFINELNEKKINYKLNGKCRIPGILNITFPAILGQTLVMKLDLNGVAVSFGSACSSGTPKPSEVLLNLGLTSDEALRTIRISIGKFHTDNDIYDLVSMLNEILCNEYEKDTA
jgi:cysteine desulfurase|tara:strand:+ start:1053 stop:2186 length:1134 start_codon:yes stop_codon:yes gene_type:complete